MAVDEDWLTSFSGSGEYGGGSDGGGSGGSSGGTSGGSGSSSSGSDYRGGPAFGWLILTGGSGTPGGNYGDPGAPPPPPPPLDRPPTYLEKVAIILDRAFHLIDETPETIHKKAALFNRMTLLMELAAVVEHYQLYDAMAGVLHGIYDEAEETIDTRAEATERGVVLAAQLLEDRDAVRTEVYQAALLTVVNQVWIDKHYPTLSEDEQQQLVNGLLELGRTYAALKPTLAPDTATTTTPDFLDSLWRAQLPTDPSTPKPYQEIRAELQRGIAALDTLLEGVEDPLGALRFVNNLVVQAVTNVESLSDDAVLDAQFLRELVMFGFEYAKLNPTVLTTATENGTEAFLATLWQGESAQTESIAMRQATGKLSELFAGFDTPEARLQWLRFATNLVQAVGQSLAPEENANPVVVSALIELGAMYAQLNPTAPSTEPPLNFFLDTLWQAQDEVRLQTGAEQLQAFIQDSADPTRLLKLATGLLRAMEALSLELPPDAQVLSALLELGKAYAVLDPIATTTEGDASLNFFLDTLWQNQDAAAIQKGTEELKQFLEDTNSPSLPLLKFGTNLLKATKVAPEELQQQKHEPKFLSALMQVGGAYTALDPIPNSAWKNNPLFSSLDTLWQAQDEQEIVNGANKLGSSFQGLNNSDKLNLLIFGEYALKLAQQFSDVIIAHSQQEPVPPPSTVNPVYRVFDVFPGPAVSWFMQHYFEGNGEPVDLEVWGLLDEYRSTPEVAQGISKLSFDATNYVNRHLTSANPVVNGELETQVNTTFTFFVMGNSNLVLRFTATLDTTIEPQAGLFSGAPDFVSYPYKLRLEYSVSDRFDDVPDTANLIDDEKYGKIEFPGGTPYDLRASWTIESNFWTVPH
ncbi:hypothetical protein HJG54_17725 [Leptolyngbya sp. NK1-12]|uniref:Uncharacterized protein n=1 Tax=Leptolyngbya sp. NK1-12 TaxID=2547451 RepID=A0AA97AHT4_9CYAN|nr:hypothetical protein [Leptolyngbya sp. NK1-12]WNZ21392.1 hypothetical protein HJG54_17725 [Leptolyngbya sp. NK1-12]